MSMNDQEVLKAILSHQRLSYTTSDHREGEIWWTGDIWWAKSQHTGGEWEPLMGHVVQKGEHYLDIWLKICHSTTEWKLTA